MKNRTAIGIVCIILAVAVTFVVSPFVNKISEQKVEVFRFTKDISQGTQITDADFEIAEILKANVPANAITEKDKVDGLLPPHTYGYPRYVTHFHHLFLREIFFFQRGAA